MVDWMTVQQKRCEEKSVGNRAEESEKQRHVDAILIRMRENERENIPETKDRRSCENPQSSHIASVQKQRDSETDLAHF